MNCSPDEHPASRPPASRASLESFGVRFGVESNRPEILASLGDFLPPIRVAAQLRPRDRVYSLITSTAAGAAGDVHRLYVDSRLQFASADPLDLFDHVEGDLQIHLGEMARRFVFVHAGVVAWNGTAIVIPGTSFCGKSTLVAALVRAGATYFSDEFAVLDECGAIHPYPRRLSLRENGKQRGVRRTVESLGGRCGTEPVRPGLVLLTRYQPGAVWTPQRVAPSEAMFELVGNSLSIRRQPGPVLEVLGRLANEALVLRSNRGEAAETAACLLLSDFRS
jgi:hypothetical protein